MVHRAQQSRRRMGLRQSTAALVLICLRIGTLSRTHLCTYRAQEEFVIYY